MKTKIKNLALLTAIIISNSVFSQGPIPWFTNGNIRSRGFAIRV